MTLICVDGVLSALAKSLPQRSYSCIQTTKGFYLAHGGSLGPAQPRWGGQSGPWLIWPVLPVPGRESQLASSVCCHCQCCCHHQPQPCCLGTLACLLHIHGWGHWIEQAGGVSRETSPGPWRQGTLWGAVSGSGMGRQDRDCGAVIAGSRSWLWPRP